MRNWINLLEKFEAFGTSNALYHGTDLDAMWLIIRSGVLDPEVEGRDYAGPLGVSLSRSFKIALDHSRSRTLNLHDSFFDYFDLGSPPPLSGVVFEFDRSKITQEIIPFDDFGDQVEEEERIVGKLPLEPSLKHIWVKIADVKTFLALAVEAHKKGGSEYDDKFKEIIRGVLSDPRLRPY